MTALLWLLLLPLALAGFWVGRSRAHALARVGRPAGEGRVELHSLPQHYGQYVLIWAALPPLAILMLWVATSGALVDRWATAQLETSGLIEADAPDVVHEVLRDVRSGLAAVEGPGASPVHVFAATAIERAENVLGASLLGLFAAAAAGGLLYGRARITMALRARNRVEQVLQAALMASSLVAILTTIGIVVSLFFEALRFFQLVSPGEFFFSIHWSPRRPCAPIRSAPPVPLVPCRSSPARSSSRPSRWRSPGRSG